MRRYVLGLTLVGMLLLPMATQAVPPSDAEIAFGTHWHRWDRAIQDSVAERTWTWGPYNLTGSKVEPYAEAAEAWNTPAGFRQVYYFDKARMEYDPTSSDPLWRVTTGLLATELITGQMQLGHTRFEPREPARIPVAGDPDSDLAPTYAALQPLLDDQPFAAGMTIVQTLDASGTVGSNQRFASYGVTATDIGAPTDHMVASVFWSFMTSRGIVREFNPAIENYEYVEGQIFPNPFYATGYPITEAYWASVQVAGQVTEVLLQCFERRCLTYTPANPANWQVEFGNIGRHYFIWRYPGETPPEPFPIEEP